MDLTPDSSNPPNSDDHYPSFGFTSPRDRAKLNGAQEDPARRDGEDLRTASST
jgi:hypothetical protein